MGDYWTVSDVQSALFGSSDSSILEQRLNFIFTHSEEYQMSLRPFLQEAASAKKWQYNNWGEDYWICTVQFGSSDSLGGLFYYFDGNLERHKSSVYKNFVLSFPISM